MSDPKMKLIIRLGLYLLGLFITALGINLTIRADLGVTPVSGFTLSLSRLVGASLGTVTIIVYALFVLAEIVLLGRRFKARNLLQLLFNFAFGFFLDLGGILVRPLTVHGYVMQLLWLVFGVLVMSLGVMLFLSMDIVPNAPDGIVLAICEKTGSSYARVKFIFDCACVILSLACTVLFPGRISTVREGTVIAALLTGRLVGLFSKPCGPWLRKVAFTGDQQLALAVE